MRNAVNAPAAFGSVLRHYPAFCSYNSRTMSGSDYAAMLQVAIAEARKGLAEGGIPIGAAIFDASGKLIGAGHNRRIQTRSHLTVASTDDRSRHSAARYCAPAQT